MAKRRLSRLEISKKDIFEYFDSLGSIVYQKNDIAQHLSNNRDSWRLAKRTTALAFIEFLKEKGSLVEHYLSADSSYTRSHYRYSWGGKASQYLSALSMKKNSYICHGTAVYLHGLNHQIPKVVYVNEEQGAKTRFTNELLQANLKLAFSRKQRISQMVLTDDQNDNSQIIVVNGKNTGGLGVEEITVRTSRIERIRVTGIERTLIDIVVRPAYAGGIHNVLEAYISAKESVSVNRLNALLTKLDYTYPYHQAIGFLMEKAGYKASLLDLMKKRGLNHDFYLTHGMKDQEFDKDWRLFIPRDF